MDVTGFFFFAGGVAMLAHLVLCALLLRGLANNGAAKEALMAIPDRPLVPTSSIRLLRAGYYLPWQSLPSSTSDLEPWARWTLLASRITGLLCIASMFGFLAAEIATAATIRVPN
jgi:hypothetical protein